MNFNDTADIPGLCKQITQLSTHKGTLDIEELNRRLGMLVADRLLDHMNYTPQPKKPDAIINYGALSKNQKFVFEKENPNWRQSSEIVDWLNKSSKADCENGSHVQWLRHWMTCVDDVRKKRIQDKLLEFKVRIHVRAVPVSQEPNDPKVREVKALFGGTVVESIMKGVQNESDAVRKGSDDVGRQEEISFDSTDTGGVKDSQPVN